MNDCSYHEYLQDNGHTKDDNRKFEVLLINILNELCGKNFELVYRYIDKINVSVFLRRFDNDNEIEWNYFYGQITFKSFVL